MGRYLISSGQNLYDVALHLYGSIEGITDLLVNNPGISMADELHAGQELTYTDDYRINDEVSAYLRQKGITPANGERNVYFKESQYPRVIESRLPVAMTSASISFSGSGAMDIDWGDNTPLQPIFLSNHLSVVSHFFDNKISGSRIVRVYGDFRFRQVDFTALTPSTVFFLNPVYAEKITLRSCGVLLDFLSMAEGLYSLDLTKVKTCSLLPIVQCRELRTLDLSDMDVQRETLDELLIALVREHYGRRSCEVTLTQTPSGEYREPQRDDELRYVLKTGMEAVWLLTNEPAWNEGGLWKFDVNGTIYTYHDNSISE